MQPGLPALGRLLMVVGAASFLPLACSTGPGEADAVLGKVQAEVRLGLQSCGSTSDCSSGLECCGGHCALPATASAKLAYSSNGTLAYKCYENRNISGVPKNILPDFSYAGYRRGQSTPPTSQPCETLIADPRSTDDTQRIQSALDRCSVWTPAAPNTRAVVLGPGTFTLPRPLWIRENGVVLRGAGQGKGPSGSGPETILHSTRPIAHTLIRIAPHADGDVSEDNVGAYPVEETNSNGSPRRAAIATAAVPVGATRFTLQTDLGLSEGDSIVIVRTPSAAWLEAVGVGTDWLGWWEPAESVLGNPISCSSSSPCAMPKVCSEEFKVCATPCDADDPNKQCANGQTCRDKICTLPMPFEHVRKVEQYSSSTRQLRIDIPLVDPIYSSYGGGYVARLKPAKFIEKSGVEDLRITAQYHDVIPETCDNGTPNDKSDDELCGCPRNGDTCSPQTVLSDCGHGYSCLDNDEDPPRKVCTCKDVECQSGGSCTQTRCQNGARCVAGVCECPGEVRVCGNDNRYCTAKDGNWNAIVLERATNSFVRRVTVEKYGMSAVSVTRGSSFNTVEEVAHLDPLSPVEPGDRCTAQECQNDDCENNGNPLSGHRYSFNVGPGVGNLFQRLYARRSRHTFVSGSHNTGPHVWLDSVGQHQMADIGPHQRFATGLLFDNILAIDPDYYSECAWGARGLGVTARDAGGGGADHGWRGAQVMFWNVQAPANVQAPPTAMNWVVGGIVAPHNDLIGTDADPKAGYFQLESTTVKPRSLYIEQLRARDALYPGSALAHQQTRRRIWDDILRWKGEGKLLDYTADPECSEGSPSLTSAACCDPACGPCEESHPNSDCRPSTILARNRSCETVGAPCFRADPTCQWGKKFNSNTRCCPASCASCAPLTAPAGCVMGTRLCGEFPAPCALKDPECVAGVEGHDRYDPDASDPVGNKVCCNKDCQQCGGSGCGAQSGCCMGSIISSGISCDSSMATCILD